MIPSEVELSVNVLFLKRMCVSEKRDSSSFPKRLAGVVVSRLSK